MNNSKLIKIILRLQDEVSGNVGKATNSLQKMGSTLTSVGTQMTAAFTVPIVAAGAAGVKMAMDLDKAMRNIQSISKQTDAEIAALSDTFIQMSTDLSKTTDSAQNLAEAFYQIQGSGFAGADAMQILEVATKGATAGLTDTSTAANSLTQVLNAYNLEASESERVMDTLFQTVNIGVGSFEDLSASLANVTGVAASLGIPLEEVAAGMATLSKNGMEFERAARAMRQAMTNLINPTAEGQKIIEQMGYASGQAMIDALGFAGALQAIAEHTGNSTTEMSKLFSDVDGLQAVLGLTGDNAQKFAADLEAMGLAAGATSEAFAIQTQSFDAAWKNFQNTLNALLIEVGQVLLPVLTGFMQQVLIPMIQAFRALPAPVQQFIIGLLAILAVVGPILLIVGQLIGAFTALASIAPVLGTAFAAFMALGAPVIALIAAIVVAIGLLIANWNQLGTTLQQLGAIIDHATGGFFSKLATTFDQLVKLAGATLSQMASFAYEMGVGIITGLIKGIASKAVDLLAYVFGLSEDMAMMVKMALGISSPSKVMMKLGQQSAEGFQMGLGKNGGLDVGVTANGRPVNGSAPALATAGAGGGGYGPVTINVYSTNADPRKVAEEVDKILGKKMMRKGARK